MKHSASLRRTFLKLLSATLVPLGALAQTPTELAPLADESLLPSPAREFLLDGPEIYKASMRSRDLIVEDLNGNGLLDIAVVSNERSLLEVYYQDRNPAPGAPRFQRETVTLDRIIRSTVAVDVDGDGRIDLLMAAAPQRLVVMYQDAQGRLQPPRETPLSAARLATGDISGDNRPDVVVYTDRRIDILPSQRRGIELEPSQTFYTTGEPASDLMVIDLDGDGRNDIVYHDSQRLDELVVRLQSAEKTFPSEFRVSTSQMRAVAPFSRGRGEKAGVAAVHNVTRSLMLLELSSNDAGQATATIPLSRIQTVPFNPENRSGKVAPVTADVDGDGRPDVVLYSPDLSHLRVLQQTRAGNLVEHRFPTFQGIESVVPIAVGRGKPAPLLLFSPGEKAVAIAQWDTETGAIPFPKILPVDGEPVGATVVNVGDNRMLAVMTRPSRGTEIPVLTGYLLNDDHTIGEAKWLYAREGLESDFILHRADVVALETIDVNRNGRDDLVVYADFRPAYFFLQNEEGRFEELRATSAVLEGLLAGATPRVLDTAALSTGRNARPSVLATKEKFARAFYIDDERNVLVEHQFNGKNASSRIVSATAGSLRSSNQREVILLDRGNRILTIHGRGQNDGDFQPLEEYNLDQADYTHVRALDLDGDGKDDILLVAEDRLSIVYSRPIHAALDAIAAATPADEEGAFGKVYASHVLPGNVPQLLAVEMRNNMMEMFVLGRNEQKAPALHRFYRFVMFDADMGLARRVNLDAPPEPRELVVADLNDDGKIEIVALMHDNIVIYRQVEARDEIARME